MKKIETAAVNTRLDDDLNDEQARRASISDSYLLKMLGRFLRPYAWQIGMVFVLLMSVSGLTVLLPLIIQRTIDGPILSGDLTALLPYGLAYLGLILLIFVLRFAYTYWLQTIGQNALMNLRQTLFEHIVRQDMNYFNATPVGKIVSRMSNDIEALTELLSTSIVMVASNLLTLGGIIVVMLGLTWRLALISMAVLPIMTFLSVYFRRRIRAASTHLHKVMAEYQAFLNEQFGGMLIVQLFGRQQRTREDFEAVNREYFKVHTDLRDVYTVYASLLQILTTVGLAVVLYGGGSGVLAGWATLGMLVAFIEYTRRSFEPILMLSEQFAQIQTAFSAGERIARMLMVEPTVQEAAQTVTPAHHEPRLDLQAVRFAYVPGHPVVDGVDLQIEPGQRVAIVGATGAGKTTLVKLLARYYDVNEGRILISGVDVRDLSLRDLRRFITVVPQNPYVFNGTIADNLRLFDLNITREQMESAARTACAAPFIERLPGSYDFVLLPGGANLSHGQRQLLALARALIHSPQSILVLDEATSNIDTETEELIQQGLAQVLKDRTSLIIAHRLSTIRDADRILVMKRGRIVEEGTHDALLLRGGVYAQLYQRQFAHADLRAAGD